MKSDGITNQILSMYNNRRLRFVFMNNEMIKGRKIKITLNITTINLRVVSENILRCNMPHFVRFLHQRLPWNLFRCQKIFKKQFVFLIMSPVLKIKLQITGHKKLHTKYLSRVWILNSPPVLDYGEEITEKFVWSFFLCFFLAFNTEIFDEPSTFWVFPCKKHAKENRGEE